LFDTSVTSTPQAKTILLFHCGTIIGLHFRGEKGKPGFRTPHTSMKNWLCL